MYERNAIVVDRYFSNIFGYDKKNNLKVNKNNYFELVDTLEKYQNASEIENNIMDEFENVASKIKETQKKQEGLNKRTLKLFENRKALFENLDEDEENLKKEFEKLEANIRINENEIKDNSDRFVEEIRDFNEKSEIRSKCGRERRIIESDYQKILNVTVENFNNILKDKLREIKAFIKNEDKEETKEQMKENIFKNGAKEKVPFDSNVINKAIDTSLYIEGKKVEILLSIYDKTSKLLNEIKNDTVKIEKHKKQVKDSKSKLEFLNVITDYIIMFLDNERMNTMGGKTEHEKIMSEACDNLQNDLIEIQNMYSILIKEINGKATKKLYKQLYNIDYLNQLKEQEVQFEKSISKLNMSGTVIYPDFWRVEGMQKIYDVFRNLITDVYEVDLSEFEPLDITYEVKENLLDNDIEDKENNIDEEISENIEAEKIENKENVEKENNKETTLKFEYSEDKNININIKDNEDEEDEFQWDEDDEVDELIFDKSKEIDDFEEDEIIENNEEEYKKATEITETTEIADERDKEIDELLGIFDTEEDIEEDDDNDSIEDHILQIENDEDELDDSIFNKDEEDTETKKEKKDKKEKKEKTKRKSLFGRRK